MSAATTEHEYEPVRGLPATLPPGEELLWQGAPRWQALALRAYRVRALAAYFAILAGARGVWTLATGGPVGEAASNVLGVLLLGALALGILAAIAYFAARATVYSVTSRRVVIRQGIALPVTLNLPYAAVESAGLHMYGEEVGDVALEPAAGQRVSYAAMWPHVRPWKYRNPQPTLRAIPDARRVAALLTQAYAAAVAGTQVNAAATAEPATPRPERGAAPAHRPASAAA